MFSDIHHYFTVRIVLILDAIYGPKDITPELWTRIRINLFYNQLLSALHSKQVKILKKLSKSNGKKFSELGRGFDFDDKFPYHLKQLIKNQFIYKKEELYFITKEGMQASMFYDTETFEPLSFKHVHIGLVLEFESKFLIHAKDTGREVFHYFPRGKILFGETTGVACLRILTKEAGIEKANFEYISTHLKRQRTSSGKLLFDNAWLFFKVKDFDSTFNLQEKNTFMSLDEIEKLPNKWPEIDLILFKEEIQPFCEYDFVCDYNLLEG
jgi:hypothetical protein